MSAWLSKNSNGLLGLLGLVVVVVGIDFAPAWLGDKLETLTGRIAADPNGTTAVFLVVVGAVATAIGVLRAAWQRDPNAAQSSARASKTSGSAHVVGLLYVAAAGLAFAAGCSLLSGCTPSQWSDAAHIAKPVLKWSCALANALCVKGSDDVACGIVAAGCGLAEPLLEAAAAQIPTSGGESAEPHDLSVEE